MIHIEIPSASEKRRLPFYLAVEEWVAERLPADEYFFCWQVDPTVIMGRNQRAEYEVDLEYCREHSIQVYRRRSGGGCVYADHGNLMTSYITPHTDVAGTFATFTSGMARALRQLGVAAETTGRNDIAIEGRKISGNAYYRRRNRSIVHGTMLFTTDAANMANAITPSQSKLAGHAVQSVQSRITTICEHSPGLTPRHFVEHLKATMATGAYRLTDADLAEVAEIEQPYYNPARIYGPEKHAEGTGIANTLSRRIPGVGTIDLTVNLGDDQRIEGLEATGDFFLFADIDTSITEKIKGCRPTGEDVAAALADVDTAGVIAGLDTATFVTLLVDAAKTGI